MTDQQQPSGSSPRVPGGIGLWIAGGSTTLIGLLVLLVVLAVMGVMSARRPLCQSAADTAAAAPASAAGRDQIPAELVPIYQAASAKYKLGADGWLWLAAFNREETDFGRDLNKSSAGAIGWMQFMPATWAQYGVDGDGDGIKDPWDKTDGIFGAANYLHALGAPESWANAAFGYNHAGWYVTQVTDYHDTYLAKGEDTVTATVVPVDDDSLEHDAEAGQVGTDPTDGGCDAAKPDPGIDGLQLTDGERAKLLPDGTAAAPASAPQVVKEMIAAGNQIQGTPYAHFGRSGTHGTPYTTTQEVYDCSSSVAYILFHAGQITDANQNWTSGSIAAGFGTAGSSKWVTIRANGTHVFMYVAGLRWDTHLYGAGDSGNKGIGWHTGHRPDDADFTPRTLAAATAL